MRITLSVLILLAGCDQKPKLAAGPPKPPLFCAKTLGDVECYKDPANLADHPPQLADTPTQHKEPRPWWRFNQDPF